MTHLYGIRHHGPGSARSLLRALESAPPDCLLIEAPADAESLISTLTKADWGLETPAEVSPNPESPIEPRQSLTAPVAILLYNPKDISQASYFPFASFSPEWTAIRFAAERGIPLRFIDLPMSMNFALDAAEKEKTQIAFDNPEKLTEEERLLRQDPMAMMAKLAGYSDSERWWEVMFESTENPSNVFVGLLEMTTALREAGREETPRTLLREAHMRQCIRQAEKEGFQNIAVVCGAWHLPALHRPDTNPRFKSWAADAALLKGIKKVTTLATWIPWSYDRLTFNSGYGAGVISPAWYELLFADPSAAATHWMVRVARLFREEDLDASSAHVIEAIRLAETLATMRGLALPGIGELREAAVVTICEGDAEKLQLIETKLITGDAVGHVPDHLKLPTVPLLRDIEAEVKSCRLSAYWEKTAESWLGATATQPRGGVDLREDSGKQKSHLLHRLSLLGIPWGKRMELDRHQSAGGFKEFWKLKWSPDFTIRIIEMGAWGNTLEDACTAFLMKKTAEVQSLPALTELVRQTLDAHLPQALSPMLQRLEDLAALTADVFDLMNALPPLAMVVRYGNTRGTDTEAVSRVVAHIVPRICIGLPAACLSLDEDASKAALDALLATQRALGLLNDPAYRQPWHDALQTLATHPSVNGILRGACARILFDKKIWDEPETAVRMRYALSRTNPPQEAAQWLEGFLQGSGLLLIHNNSLWSLLDAWVSELRREDFSDVLPVLRRTFSRFPKPERARMMDLVKQEGLPAKAALSDAWDEERAGVVVATVRRLLGLRESA